MNVGAITPWTAVKDTLNNEIKERDLANCGKGHDSQRSLFCKDVGHWVRRMEFKSHQIPGQIW